MKSVNMFRKIVAYLISAAAMIYILHTRNDVHNSTGGGDEPVWALIGCATFVDSTLLVHSLFAPYQRMGVFALTVEKLISDVRVWFVFNGVYIMAFWASLYILYPRAGEKELPQVPAIAPPPPTCPPLTLPHLPDDSVPQVPEFNDPLESLKSMMDVGFSVNRFTISFSELEHLGHMEMVNWVMFALFYYATMVLIVVLLLRMLMAMLTAHFNEIREAALLEWRLRFARRVLFAELTWPTWLGDTWATPIDPISGKYQVYLVEQVKAMAADNAKQLFKHELTPEEQVPPRRCHREGLE